MVDVLVDLKAAKMVSEKVVLWVELKVIVMVVQKVVSLDADLVALSA